MAMLSNRIRDVGEQLASCPLGQIVFRFADRFLWTFEMSTVWFMKKEERKGPLVRPLPWILFLPFLLWLRFVKIVLTLTSFIRGKETLPPTKVVSYIQIYRRRLRGVKYAGLKNFTNWKMAQEEKKKGDGECIVSKLLGIYWLSAFTGIGRVITPVSSSKDNQEQLKPTVEESSETEHTMVNLNQICEESDSEDDPDYDPLADKSNSEDASDSSDCSNASIVSLETAEAGSESTSQTFYSSSNITPEPGPLQACPSAGNEPGQPASVKEIPCQTSSDNEHTQEKGNHIEENQREELSTSQNGNVPKQVHDINKSTEESILSQTSSDIDHESKKSFSADEKSQIDMTATQTSSSTEQLSEQTMPVQEKRRSDSPVLQTLTNTSHIAEHALSLEEKSIEDLPQSCQVTINVKPLPDQSTPIEEITAPKQTSSSLEEKQNEQPNDNKQLNNVQEVDSNFQEVVKSKTIFSNVPNIPQSRPTENVKIETSEGQLPNPEYHLENSIQKHSKTSIQKDSENFLKEQLCSDSKQKYDTYESEQRNELKELDDKQIQPDSKNEPIEEIKRLSASAECVYSLSNYQVHLGNPNSDLINSEISASLPAFRKSDSAIGPATSTESVKEHGTEDRKLKRRLSDFFVTKKKT